MDKYHIKGGKALCGRIEVAGSKNAALPILAASVMAKGENLISNCPDISDVENMIDILLSLGCSVRKDGGFLSVDSRNLSSCEVPDSLMREMRSSVFLAGPLLARCGKAVISDPGGCDIGKRPIDIHLEGLKKLGANIVHSEGMIYIQADNMKGADIALPYPSVGATENIMMAAVGARGTTRIINCAKEPEIRDLQDYINACGGRIRGAGTEIMMVEGAAKLHGGEHKVMPDRIEAGTFLLMALGTGGRVCLHGIDHVTIKPLLDILGMGGFDIRTGHNTISAASNGREHVKCEVSTAPYPGFPTDLQPQMTAFLSKCGEGSVVEENIFEKRLEYTKELKKMGADIEISEKKVIINSNKMLYGTEVCAKDLRGGAALVIAGLMADNETIIRDTKYIKRGYERFREKIAGIGGDIT